MDRNTFTGLFLIMIILAGSFYFFKPSDTEIKKERERITADSIKKAEASGTAAVASKEAITTATPIVAQPDTTPVSGLFANATAANNATTILENQRLKLTLSNKGGKITEVLVKGEKTFDGKPLILFTGDKTTFGLQLNIDGKQIQTNDLNFTPTVKGNQVSMRANYSADKYVEFLYDLQPNSNNLTFNISLVGLNGVIQNNAIMLDWQTTLLQQEKSLPNEQRYSSSYYKYQNQNPDYLTVSKDKKEVLDKGKIEWISFKQHFFSAILIPKDGFDKGSMEVKLVTTPGQVKTYGALMQLPFNQVANQTYPMTFYFGTNKFSVLKSQGHEIEKLVDMGYWPLKYINRFVVLPLFNWLEGFNIGYGFIILILTLLIKGALSPLTYKSYLSMAKMRVLKPEMDEIKAKLGDENATLLQQEYLKLYKKVGVNPLGGCLPMVLQMPFIMAFFFFFPNLFELRGQSFLWMNDLSTYDEFIKFGTNIPFIGNHLSLMCLLMTISQLIQAYYNNLTSAGATNNQMKYIGYVMPVIFLGVLNSYPSGLNYYYFLANMITFGMQFVIRNMVDDDKIHAMLKEKKAKPDEKKKKSKFQARLDDYMKDQQLQKTKK